MSASFTNIGKVPELRSRLLFTIAMLAVYRLGIFISVPGVDRGLMQKYLEAQSGTLFGMFNMFVGGALEKASVFSLGIMPYISASIILQLMTVVVPTLERLSKEGEQGRKKITQYTRYGTILLSVIQGTVIASNIESLAFEGQSVVINPGLGFTVVTILSLTAGTAFIMWLGEQITERGIGNGMSLIIFAGIIAGLPQGLYQTFQLAAEEVLKPLALLFLAAFIVVMVAVVVFVERGQRRIPVQYAKRVVGRQVYGGQTSHLPLKVNTANVIPAIFASSLLLFPATIVQFFPQSQFMQALQGFLLPTEWGYNAIYVGLIMFFTFFYTSVIFNPVDVADNLKKAGGYIPGVRPGQKTAEYIDRVLTRLTVGAALYLAVVCVVPNILLATIENLPFYFGGTALLIVVGVALDTVNQIEAHLINHSYDTSTDESLPSIRGRRPAT
ncbi:MAG: preprotein translocase subunit SecY [Myxococcales bacterium]|nr:preprotein translocase subunit SecY [Myxococcales bacterium]